ncbi:MAG: exosortase A [Desulfococcaceae bacterium]
MKSFSMEKFQVSTFAQVGLLALVFAWLFQNTLSELIADWSANDNYSHGFLIPFISAYMVWQKREALAEISQKTNFWGLGIVAFGVFLHLVGNVGAELFTTRFSLVVMVAGLVAYLFGFRALREVAIPVAYLIFMIPLPAIIWNKIAFPLQLFAAKLTADVVRLIGIPILREGNVLHLASTSLEVVDACSGLRSLTSLLALAAAFAYIGPLRNWSKWILFLSAVPIAVFVNIVRLTATAIMAHRIGEEAAQGFLHDMSGMLVFGLAFVLVFAFSAVLSKAENRLYPASGAAPDEEE